MPIWLPNSLTIGPRGGVSAPATLVDYLASIGITSYSRFLASSGLTANSDGSGGTPADGGAVGKWAAIQQSGYSFSFTQATSGSRPAYGSNRGGIPGVYGNASSWFLACDSTSALNNSFTMLISALTVAETASVISQNSNQVRWSTSPTGTELLTLSGTVTDGTTAPQVFRREPSGGSLRVRGGFTHTGTGHNGTAMNLLRRTSNTEFSQSTIHEMLFCPALTAAQIQTAITYLV